MSQWICCRAGLTIRQVHQIATGAEKHNPCHYNTQVFDGHGGRGVSRFAAKHLGEVLKKNPNYIKGDYSKALYEYLQER